MQHPFSFVAETHQEMSAVREIRTIPWLRYQECSSAEPQRYQSSHRHAKPATKLLRLLAAREQVGLRGTCSKVGWMSEGVLVSHSDLAAAGAWNSRRLQNMTLAIGPGTPAACVSCLDPSVDGDTIGSGSIGAHSFSSNDNSNDIHDQLESGEDDVSVEVEDDDESDQNETEENLHLRGGREQLQQQSQSNSRRSQWEKRHQNFFHLTNSNYSSNDSTAINMTGLNNDGNQSHQTHVQFDDFINGDDPIIHQEERVQDIPQSQISQNHSLYQQSQYKRRSSDVKILDAPCNRNEREVARSMKHGGCINTACWLDCGWRISTVYHENTNRHDYFFNDMSIMSSSYSSSNFSSLAVQTSVNEYPTQLITSGDDYLVKFWDVSLSMGSISPLPGGSATWTPFSAPKAPTELTSELINKWTENAYRNSSNNSLDDSSTCHSHRRNLPGTVHPLLTLATGHRGNVFHATPVPYNPGKVVTCAADGFLRLSDVEINSTSTPASHFRGRLNHASASSNASEVSAIIVSPEYYDDETVSSFRLGAMCFSHHFLNSNVGLICSERGLLHFDLRLPARSQKRGSIVEELKKTCKSCCVWASDSSDYERNMDSAYVFAGGSGIDVALYDIRMTGRPGSQSVKRYRPRPLRHKSSVSVSGIDLSKDKKELLVSYENDQIYTFPIFPHASIAGPTVSDMDTSSDDKKADRPVSELAQYGGHLNRLTFLKMAKYAGPNDEYICTGSDSGHAWIYEKSTGAVVSFIRADHSTCNGIMPHPSLPYFVTYGIDSTAKLWRATIPVDNDIDDSDMGRFTYYQKMKYERSTIVDLWGPNRWKDMTDLDCDDCLFPDETPSVEEDFIESMGGGFMRMLFARRRLSQVTVIGNDFKSLSNELKKNYFLCAHALRSHEDLPLKSGHIGLKRRMSLIESRYQADQLGLKWNYNKPWILSGKNHLLQLNNPDTKDNSLVSYGALADLIPDNPSDWMPYESLTSSPPQPCGMRFNSKRFEQFFSEMYADHSISSIYKSHIDKALSIDNDRTCHDSKQSSKELDLDSTPKNNEYNIQPSEKLSNPMNELNSNNTIEAFDPLCAWDILYRTVALLKEAGSAALKASMPCLAARRYDKAIKYCSLAYLNFFFGNLLFLKDHQVALSENGGYECEWNPLLKTLIQIRLNLSLCCLKGELNDFKGAVSQAKLSLKELEPFVSGKGYVLTGRKLEKKRYEEPISTFAEAKALQAKAFFRLGSAQLLMEDFEDAVKSFQRSIKCTKTSSPESNPEPVVLRRLHEAKEGIQRKIEPQKRKFKFLFSEKGVRE